MLSKKSFEPIILTYRFAACLRCIQFYWDKDQERLVLLKHSKLKKHKRDYKIYNYLIIPQILVRVYFILFLVGKVVLNKSVESSESILAIFMILILRVSIVAHIQQFIFGTHAVLHMNALLRLNQESGTK